MEMCRSRARRQHMARLEFKPLGPKEWKRDEENRTRKTNRGSLEGAWDLLSSLYWSVFLFLPSQEKKKSILDKNGRKEVTACCERASLQIKHSGLGSHVMNSVGAHFFSGESRAECPGCVFWPIA